MKYDYLTLGQLIEKGEAEIKTGPFGTQLKASDYVDKGTPVINVRNIGFGTIVEEKLEYISDITRDRLKDHVIKENDIVFGRKGAVERHAFIDAKHDNWFQGSDCIRLRIDSNKIHPRFVSYYFLTDDHKNSIAQQCSHGTTMASLNQSILKQMKIPIPEYTEQKAIAATLSCLDEKIDLNKLISKNLEETAQAIFKSWFVDFEPFGGTIPDTWEKHTLDECCSLIVKGVTPKYSDESTQRVINQKCIRDHRIDLSLSRTHLPKVINDKWLKYGDILINSTGTGTLGRAAQILFHPNNLTVDSHVTIVRPLSTELIYYLGLWCLSQEGTFEEMATGSTGQTDLPRETLKAMSLLVPSKDVLKNFAHIVESLFSLIIANQQEIERLSKTRDTLLPKLMSGEIRVPLEEVQ